MYKKYLIITLILFHHVAMGGDGKHSNSITKSVTLNLGVGAGKNEYLNGHVGFKGVLKNNLTLGLKLWGASEFQIFYTDSPNESFSSTELQVGYGLVYPFLQLNFLSGIGMINRITRGELIEEHDCEAFFGCSNKFEKISKINVGVPFEFSITPNLKYIGLGLSFYVNINPEWINYSYTITMGLGKFW